MFSNEVDGLFLSFLIIEDNEVYRGLLHFECIGDDMDGIGDNNDGIGDAKDGMSKSLASLRGVSMPSASDSFSVSRSAQ